MSKPTFKTGDKVTWTHTTSRGSSVQFSVREGKVVECFEYAARVKQRNGQSKIIRYSSLTPADEQNELTKAFNSLATAPHSHASPPEHTPHNS